MTAQIVRSSDSFAGSIAGEMGIQEIKGKVVGNTLSWTVSLSKPVSIKLGFEATIEGDAITGNVKLGVFGNAPLTGKRI